MTRAARLLALQQAPTPFVSPSILSCDFARIADVFADLQLAGAVAAHLDVMDGHFVPNLSYGPPVIKDWRKVTSMPFDAHLMIDNPEKYLDAYVDAGCDEITVHIEVSPDPRPLLKRIRAAGCHAGLALNPPTPIASVVPYLGDVDKVLVMSVMPGFGGQAFDPEARAKVRALRALRPSLRISIDGGIKTSNAREVVLDGVNQLVVGSGVFRPDSSIASALAELTAAACGATGPPEPPSA